MKTLSFKQIALEGIWHKNAALVQLLGLCPLLAVSTSVVNALAMGIATLWVFVSSNLFISLIRQQINEAIRLPSFIMIIASLVTIIELLMNAFYYQLYQILGIFIPLIVTNCSILARADAFAAKNKPIPALLDGLMMGFGFLIVLVILGAIRELLGTGTLFANMQMLFGPSAQHWLLPIFPNSPHFLFAILPPGGFILLGLLVAGKNIIDQRKQSKNKIIPNPDTVALRRVRTTGKITPEIN